MKIVRPFRIILSLTILLYGLSGCVYYNTFYNAKKEFNAAEKMRKQTGSGSQASYRNAIEKSLKVIEDHPNSKYYDDALYVVAASYYHTQQYSKAERRFRELLANFPESEFARQSMVYLAQSKLKLADHDAAIELFEEIFEGDYDKSYKADAAMELGLFHAEEKEPERARAYFMAVRDSLGNDPQKLTAQKHLADSYYDQYDFGNSLKAYLQILGMKPDKDLRYHSLTRAAFCSYRLQRITTGLDYLKELSSDQLYYDSLGAIQLIMAKGFEYMGDLTQAEETYEDIVLKAANNNWVTESNYQLGLIYQFDYDDLPKAKSYYDKAARGNQQLTAGSDAVQRSADIAKLQMIEAKQKANRETEEKARAEAEKKKADSTNAPANPTKVIDSSGTPIAASPAIDTLVRTDSVAVDSLFKTVEAVDSTTDSAAVIPVLPDTVIADSTIPESIKVTVLPTDSLPVDTLKPDSLVIDSNLVDSTLADTTARLSNAEAIAQQSQRLKAMEQPAAPAKKVLSPEEQARADSIAAERERMAALESDADIIFQLAELYWFQLNKPDSAINELKGLIRDYPNTSFAPRAMLALSTMYREHLTDSAGADSILHEAYALYGKTDYAKEIMRLMGKVGTGEDAGYPEYYYGLAEDFLIDSANVDSARYYYQYVIDSFPNSSLGPQARFNIAYIIENYQSPGDSSVIFAYEAIIDSFPGTPQAIEAQKRITFKAPVKKQYVTPDKPKGERDEEELKPGEVIVAKPVPAGDDADSTGRYINIEEGFYKGPKGEPLILLDIKPSETRIEFTFPDEASSLEGYQIKMYFQIRLDFSGKVNDFVLKAPTPNDEVNRRAEKTVGSMSFDPLQVNQELTRKSEMITLPEEMEDPNGRWYVYIFIAEKPEYMR